jgi:hypothetical protein
MRKSSPHFKTPDCALKQQARSLHLAPQTLAAFNKTPPAVHG